MVKTEGITSQAFAAHFGEAIRVGFNWDRFFDENWQVEAVHLKTPAQLSRCFMPWYIGKTGEEVAYDHPDAVPMCLTDVPKATHILNDERQSDIHTYARTFREKQGLVEFAAPTYSLPGSKHFILDRNHRLAALTLGAVPFNVTLWNVRGPLESDCLLDLIHWLPKN